jgi:iron complex outermembrane receptor protein
MFSLQRIFFLVAIVGIASMAANAPAAYAQDYLDYGEADELVITADRTPEDAAKVPAMVTVITAKDIAESGAASLPGVLETVAGVRFSGAMAGPGSEAVSMRGFGENSYGRVLVLVDGNKVNDPDMKAPNWNAIALSGIERIEVLDGSASVQYGNSAVGGVINIITKKTGVRRTRFEAAGGSFLYNRESISHFEPMPWGNISFSAEHTGTKGYRERQEAQITNVNGKGDIFIRDNLSLSFNGFFSDLYFQLPGGLTKEEFEDDPRQALAYGGVPNWNDENTERHFGGGAGIQWNPAENIELNLPLSYRGKLIKADMASWDSYTDRTVHSFEARPQGSVQFDLFGMSLRLLGGVDLYHARLGSDIFSDKPRTAKDNSFEISQWTIGPYLTARFSPLPILSVSAGARFDTALTTSKNDDHTADGDKTHNAFVYDAGIVITPLADLKVYAKFATLFRYPFVDELVAQPTSGSWPSPGSFNNNLEPEKGFNTEIGGAYRLGTMLDVYANLFFMRLEDEIAFSTGTYPNENLDKTQRLGTNMGLSFKPIDFVSLDASYTFVNAIFIDGVNKGKHIPLVPQHKLYGSVMAHLPFGLSFGPDFEFESERYSGGDNANTNETDKIGSIFLIGAKIRFVLDKDGRQFALQLTGRNLADLHYTTNIYWGAYYPSDGRSINVSVQYRF